MVISGIEMCWFNSYDIIYIERKKLYVRENEKLVGFYIKD